jgi:hypothetical protein
MSQYRQAILIQNQLTKVNQFREALGDEGALYWKFIGIDQFEKLIRLHLTRQVQAWKTKLALPGISVEAESDETISAENKSNNTGDDLGILDLMELYEDRFEELANISGRIAMATEDLGQKMNTCTAEMNELPRDSEGNANRKDARRLITKYATDMEHYSARVEAELPLFSDALNTGINSLIRAATMSVDLYSYEDNVAQSKEVLDAIVNLRNVLMETKESMSGFRTTIDELPRMTSNLNRAKRGAANVLDRLLGEFVNGETLLSEAEKFFRDLLGKSGDNT